MTEHPAIGYGGRFASLAAWLESSDSSSGGDPPPTLHTLHTYYVPCENFSAHHQKYTVDGRDVETICSSGSHTEDPAFVAGDAVKSAEDNPVEDRSFKIRPKMMSLKRLARRAPS
eukprot:scaffold63927_cov43-Prasinocladus_malaysianus.AAC.1